MGSVVMAAVPRPLQNAYFGPAFFGMALFVAVATNRLTDGGKQTMLALCLLVFVWTGMLKIEKEWALLERASDPQNWTGVVAHRVGEQLRAAASPDLPVATTHPLFALDAGLDIHPEFATGEFAWRVGALLGPERRQLIGSTSAESLDALLAERPAGALLTEFDAKWDTALEDWAQQSGWTPRGAADPRVRIWTP
jgi:hypothetical protein